MKKQKTTMEVEWNKVHPNLVSIARAMTNNPSVTVVPNFKDTNTYTDGKSIVIAPPRALAFPTNHSRRGCGKRSENLQMLCKECSRMDRLIALLIHEIGHIVYGSFRLFEKTRRQLPPTPWLTDIARKALISNFQNPGTVTFHGRERLPVDQLTLAPYAGKFFEIFTLAMEDVRMERLSGERRPATREMLQAMHVRFLITGTGQTDDDFDIEPWVNKPLNGQIITALVFRANEMDLEKYFHPHVADAVQDEEVIRWLFECVHSPDTQDMFRHQMRLYGRLVELGFFEGSPQSDEEQDSFMDKLREKLEDPNLPPLPLFGDIGDLLDMLGMMIAHELGGDHKTIKGVHDELGEKLHTEEREELEREVNAPQEFDSPSKTIKGVAFYRYHVTEKKWNLERCTKGVERRLLAKTEPPHWADRYRGTTHDKHQRDMQPSEQLIGRELQRLRVAFQENRKYKHERNLKSGKIDSRVLGSRGGTDDVRVFKARRLPGKRDYFVTIGIDCSGSTSSYALFEQIMCVYAQAELLHRLNIPFSIIGHSSESYRGGGYDEYLKIYEVKSASEPWNSVTQENLISLPCDSGNIDGHALQILLDQTRERKETDRIIMYYSDGAMPASNYSDELATLKRGIAEAKREGIILLGVGIETDSPKAHGLDTVEVARGGDIGPVITHLGKRIAID